MKYILFYGTIITAASAAYEYDASAAAAASKILQLPVMPALFGEDRELMGHKRSSKSRSSSKSSSSSKSGDGSRSGSKDDGLADFLPHEPAPAIDDLDEYYWWDLIVSCFRCLYLWGDVNWW